MLMLPPVLQGVFFDFIWDKAKVWALPTIAEPVPLTDLAWHLDLPVWSTVIGEPRFDLAPAAVLAHPVHHATHWQRIQRAELHHPLDMFRQGSRWVILDGYHRLARSAVLGLPKIWVRHHADEYLAQICII
jgi:hypothetical protein